MALSRIAADPASAMLIFLEIRSGPQTGRKIRLTPGQPMRIGRTDKADFAFAHDSHMSSLHFSVECLEDKCRFTDLNSRNGSWFNGQRVTTAVLSHGDILVAGETKFAVVVASADASATAEFPALVISAATPHETLLALLRDEFQPLFAILDAARDIRILALLLHHKEQCQSLYEGEQGATLAQVAPYLVCLAKESPLLEALVKEGWGKSWGIYLTCPSDFQEVRRHLRHFLQVKLPSGEQVYFRFYDPRVMRVFLPTCTPEDATQFFGPIQNYLVEDESPDQLLRFVNTGQGSQKMLIALQGADQQQTARAQQPKASPTEDELPDTETWPDSPLKDEAS